MSTPLPTEPDRPIDRDREALIQSVVAEMRALSTAVEALDQLAAGHFGLNRTDQRSLDVISQAGALSPAELARAVGLSTSAVTTVVDRLERAGYLTRAPSAQDRRRTVLRATARTDELGAALFGPITAAIVDHAQRYRDEELDAIADFLAHHRRTIHARLDHPSPPR